MYASAKKENVEESAPVDKRRRVGPAGKMAPPAPQGRAGRPVLSAINSVRSDQTPTEASTDGASELQFSGRDDIERLLGEKMKGKSKNDFKGRSEQMSEYIKKLRACIRWYIETEDGHISEKGNLKESMESERQRHKDMESQLQNKVEELNTAIQLIKGQHEALQENFQQEERNKLVALESYEKEKELRVTVETLHATLSDDLERAKQEVTRLSEQLNAAQDTNIRLQDYNTSLQHYNSNLQADVAKNCDKISNLQKEKNAMLETMVHLRENANLLMGQLESSRATQQETTKQKEELKKELECLRGELQQVRDDRDHTLEQLQHLQTEVASYKEVAGKASADRQSMEVRTASLEDICNSQREELLALQGQLAVANEKLKHADTMAIEAVTGYEDQKKLIKHLQAQLSDAETQISEGEKLRKKLHNTIMELKGNIRVFCRVRPQTKVGGSGDSDESVISYPTSLEAARGGIELTRKGQKYSFSFDKTFNHESSQESVFVEISQLVQSALDGYKVCIFAYGQTGSGKTYTMMGKPDPSEQKGLIPRSLEQIFETSQTLQSKGWTYKMQASMLEIYNETIRDLLLPGRPSNFGDAAAGGGSRQYNIREDENKNIFVQDLTIVDVYSMKDVSFLLNQAVQSRSVGKTLMNEQSSRSHFVFTLRISGMNESTDEQRQGVLNLIDLAGSERLDKSGSTGDRLKETLAINTSLSALSDVICSIGRKAEHVPYRNSKLTYLLKPCLGGNSKTLMFVNISPEASSAGETLESLRFAAKVNSCEIGIPRRTTEVRPVDSRLSYS